MNLRVAPRTQNSSAPISNESDAPKVDLKVPAQPGQAGVRAHLDKFFDVNKDRRITVPETFNGLRRLGLGRMAASAAALAINVGLGRTTGGSLLTVNLDGIEKGKHGSDSGIIDANGHFVQERFDALFTNYSKTVPDALTEAEVTKFRQDNLARDNGGIADKVAGLGEFGLLFRFGAQEVGGQPVLTRQRLNEFYHGDLFHTLADEHVAKREERSGSFTGQLQNLFNTWIF